MDTGVQGALVLRLPALGTPSRLVGGGQGVLGTRWRPSCQIPPGVTWENVLLQGAPRRYDDSGV